MSSRPKTVQEAQAASRTRREGYDPTKRTERVRLARMAKRGDKRAQEVLDNHAADLAANEGDDK